MGKLKIKLTFGSCKKGSKPIEEKVGGGLRWRGVPITNSYIECGGGRFREERRYCLACVCVCV
jgi:hypothetical protein